MKKRLLFTLLAAAAAMCLLSVSALADTTSADGLEYTVSEDTNTCTVTAYKGTAGSVTIPDKINEITVTGIGIEAFSECSIVTSVTIPSTVTSIGEMAFMDCTALASVTFAGTPTVTQIDVNAFNGCTALRSIYLPDSIDARLGFTSDSFDHDIVLLFKEGSGADKCNSTISIPYKCIKITDATATATAETIKTAIETILGQLLDITPIQDDIRTQYNFNNDAESEIDVGDLQAAYVIYRTKEVG